MFCALFFLFYNQVLSQEKKAKKGSSEGKAHDYSASEDMENELIVYRQQVMMNMSLVLSK